MIRRTLAAAVLLLAPSGLMAAEPDVATVRDWLDEQLYLSAPDGSMPFAFETAGEPEVVAVAGGVEARLPGATLWSDEVLLVLGDVILEVTAGEGDLLQVDVELAENIPVTDPTGGLIGELALREPAFGASLDPTTGFFVDGAVTTGGATFSLSSGLAWLEAGAIDLRWNAEQVAERRWTLDELIAVAGLSGGTTAGHGVEMSALTVEGRYLGFDLESYGAFLDTGVDPLALNATGSLDAQSIRVLADFVDFVSLDSLYERVRAADVRVTLPTSADFDIAALDLTGTTSRLDGGGAFDLDYRYDVQGLALDIDGPVGALTPRDVDVRLQVSRLPVVGLLRAFERYVMAVDEEGTAEAVASAALLAEIQRLLREADTELRLVDSRLDGPLLTASFDGVARPDATASRGATGLLTVELAGFAKTQEELGRNVANLDALKLAAGLAVLEIVGEPVDDRPDARRYRLAATADGAITLNDAPIDELLALLAPETRP